MAKRKRSMLELASWIAGIVGAIVAVAALLLPPRQGEIATGHGVTQMGGDGSIQVGTTGGNVYIGRRDGLAASDAR